MIGIVVVSHSRPLAEAAVALACEMVTAESRPPIAVAAGASDGLGTDAAAIADALAEVGSPDGVLVLMDLGSALLSAELALELVETPLPGPVRLTAAPLVEGLVAAVVTAGAGSSLEQVAAEAENGLAAKQVHLGASAPAAGPDLWAVQPELTVTHVVHNRHGLHARPAAALVTGLRELDATVRLKNLTTGRGPVEAGSITRVATLDLRQGASLEASFAGPQASAAQQRFLELAATDFGEDPAEQPSAELLPGGTGTGREVVLGPALVRSGEVSTGGYQPQDPVRETQRLASARAEVDCWLSRLAQSPTERGIFEAQRALLSDPALAEHLSRETRSGVAAVDAVRHHLDAVAADFDDLSDPYLRERGQDVRSLRRLLLLALTGAAEPDPAAAHVLVVDELDAATAARLDPSRTLGVVTVTGGPTGHGVIVAGARGIPVLTGCRRAGAARDGDLIGFDPTTHELWLSPGPEQAARIRERGAARTSEVAQAAQRARQPALTRDGTRVLVECNIGSLDDARRGAAAGADGSGLVRTEIVFADEAQAPSAEEQAEVFVTAGEILGGPITVRVWDPGADKPLSFVAAAHEPNPMLGLRGIRALQQQPDLLATQLRAVLIAAGQVPVRVLLPMVTEPREVRWAREVLDQVRRDLPAAPPVPLGIMIEVPAAAVRARDFAGLVDFASIGTNDLTQYTMAADRGNERVRDLAPAGAAAVWDLVEATCQGLPGVPVGVCGDLASDPDRAAGLIGRGVTELSVQPPLVGLVKQAVRLASGPVAAPGLSAGCRETRRGP